MSALEINTCRKGRKWDWTEGEIGLLSNHNASANSEGNSEKRFFNILHSREQVFYLSISHTCHFLLNQYNLCNAINIADRYRVMFWVITSYSVLFRLFYDRGQKSNIALGQGCKCIVLSFPRECELFLFSFLIGMEKNAFARSKVAYHVPEALLIFPSNNTTLPFD